ncbi:ETC complex I subunit [Methylobacterium sp. WL116]|uniref:ETC complex I subunit n=1 Tax=Methylobacterium sp. WL116 TaxID=2603889 RepID=UPI0011CBB875|nr:ETC complex I subunit [Methylobacterium sp. WL116]TXM93892.1 ETC complex I subunit [Methylobacterium sp. WL116]
MSSARIFQPSKDASQSGTARTKVWHLDFDQTAPRETDPLMGWTGSGDMLQQVHLKFETLEDAVAYAKKAGIVYRVEEPKTAPPRKGLSYSDNFKFNRTAPWTH